MPKTPTKHARPIDMLAGAVLVGAGIIAGSLFWTSAHTRAAPSTSAATSQTKHKQQPRVPRVQGRAPVPKGAAKPLGIPPWKATPDNTPPIPKGHLAPWEVNPPAPDPNVKPPPEPTAPPDPTKNPVPRHNPGGVDGDRGPRPAP